MTEDLNFPIEIVVCPIVREPDGLAMSSRKCLFLTPINAKPQRFYIGSLSTAKALTKKANETPRSFVKILKATIAYEPLAANGNSLLRDYDTLQEIGKSNRKDFAFDGGVFREAR